ncbi:MAG: SPOR domain-containing protein [Deltaproteobacteria bacterium]
MELDNIKISLLKCDYDSAIREGEKIMANAGQSQGTDELYYLLGLSYLKDGNYLRASDIFEIILNEFKSSRFREEAQLGLGDAYFLKNDCDKARKYYEGLLSASPNSKFAAAAYYRLSRCAFKNGDSAQAEGYLQKLKLQFPLNLEVRLNQDLTPSVAAYTVQVGSFSKKQNAENLTQKLIRKGYPAFLEAADMQGTTAYRVKVGSFNSRQDAVNLADKLFQEGYPTKICP